MNNKPNHEPSPTATAADAGAGAQEYSRRTDLAVPDLFIASVIDAIREPLLVLDTKLRVISANRAFQRDFPGFSATAAGKLLHELDEGAWDIPKLRHALQDVVQSNAVVNKFEMQHDFGKGVRTLQLNARRVANPSGQADLILLAIDDVTQRYQSIAQLAAAERKYRELFEAIDDGFCIIEMLYDDEGKPQDYLFVDTNPTFELQTGMEGPIVGRRMREFVPDHEQYWFDIYGAVAASGQARRFEAHSSVLQRWFELYAFRHDDAGVPRVAVLFRNITARKQAEQHQKMLMQELNHRVRNNLAIVHALAAQTFADAGCDAAYATFEARLQALSRAHRVLSRQNWDGAKLAEVVCNALAPWRDVAGERMQVAGPELHLNAAATLALAMALHELATNACKYGALSTGEGKLSVHWSVTENNRFRLRWRERGGPPVAEPKERGFGAWLVESGLAQDLGGQANLIFARDGLQCTLEAPLANVVENAAATADG